MSGARGIWLVTGTDTGVGKTLFTSLLVRYLRNGGCNALAVKPFCTGGRQDIEILFEAQRRTISEEEINFWFSPEPVSPLAAQRRTGQLVDFEKTVSKTFQLKERCDCLLVEGVGGLLAPLTRTKTVASLASRLGAGLFLVAHNCIGVINQVILSIEAAQNRNLEVAAVVLMGRAKPDASARDNRELLGQFLGDLAVLELPFLGPEALETRTFFGAEKKIKKQLALASKAARVCRPCEEGPEDG